MNVVHKPVQKYPEGQYQSVTIYQSSNKILSNYYWNRINHSVRLALKHSTGTNTVLDLGCASGFVLPTLEAHFNNVYGVDIFTDQAAILVKNEKLERTQIITYDGQILPFKDQKFDCIFLLDVLEHVKTSKLLFLQECKRVLKDNGLIVISFPVELGSVLLVRQIGRRLFGLEGYHMNIRKILKYVFTTKPSTHTSESDHEGYNYKADLELVNQYFQQLEYDRVPFKHIPQLSLTYIYLGKKLML